MIYDPGAGTKPEWPRPLRNEPVRRDEVRLISQYSRMDEEYYYELTMPIGTYGRAIRFGDYEYYVGDSTLWQPVLDELTREFEASYRVALANHAEHLAAAAERQPALLIMIRQMAPQRRTVPRPEISIYGAREYRCQHCGHTFLANRSRAHRPALCSNKCERQHRAALQQMWRNLHPARIREYRDKRAKQRAEARADRICEHCGGAIEAARSTRRFCSDLCRIHVHRQIRRTRTTKSRLAPASEG